MNIRHITIDPWGHIHEVIHMFDREGKRIFDPLWASTCVVVFNGEHIPQDANDVPIYTVH